MHPSFEKEKNKSIFLPNWIGLEISDLDALTRQVSKRTKIWIDRQVSKFKALGMQLTYDLMGDPKSQSTQDGITEETKDDAGEHE